MADDKDNRGERDRAQVAGGETYEVDYFANKHNISRDEAQALIDRVGNDREKLDAAAEQAAPKAARKRGSASSRAHKPARAATKPSRRKPSSTPRARSRTQSALAGPATAVTGAVVPLKQGIERAGKKAATAARRRSNAVRSSVAKAPARAKRRAGAIVEGAKATGTSRTAQLVGAAAAGLVTGLAVNLGRKVAVQAPSALAGDWLEALKLEHRMALALFDKLQATDNSAEAKRSTLLAQLKHALGKHAFTEENVVYPALRDWGDKADADKLNHDHGYVKQYLYDLEGMDKGSPAFLAKLADFRADLQAHIDEEENSIFPPLHTALGEAGNARVTALANKEGFKLA